MIRKSEIDFSVWMSSLRIHINRNMLFFLGCTVNMYRILYMYIGETNTDTCKNERNKRPSRFTSFLYAKLLIITISFSHKHLYSMCSRKNLRTTYCTLYFASHENSQSDVKVYNFWSLRPSRRHFSDCFYGKQRKCLKIFFWNAVSISVCVKMMRL